jgi:deoxyribose-phosphate aldolase
MSDERDALIEKTVKQVMAILGETRTYPRTGRTRPDLGAVPADKQVASLIDHTLLKAGATAREIEMLCYEAKDFGFAAVCVNSAYVPLAKEMLKESDVGICTVVGFPLGGSLPRVKAFEAAEAIKNGATEIDMVINIGALKSRDIIAVHEGISDVAVVCHESEPEVLCKVIIETALLTDVEKIMACQIARVAGADYVKTSTGFSTGGATVEDVELMRRVVGDGMGVKASGGVRSLDDAKAMIAAGATRIGASSGVKIAQEERGGYALSDDDDSAADDDSY